ncbi:MAG: NADP-dependent malic enzyme [Eubacteriaceae bacterium]|nr:NADP-dependent malic enzyme [Eubacteriaceae bacterium]
MDYNKASLDMHEKHRGKIEVISKVDVKTRDDLSTAYTPGVAEPCLAIARNNEEAYRYTAKGNLVAVVTDGTAVLGLGDIGPQAAMPVMEGKAILFKTFGNVDAFPICLDTKDPDEIVETVVRLAPTFGGINLEDISAPRCFEIEAKLKEKLNIPVFHDDQHGTAIVVLAAIIGGLRIKNTTPAENRVVISGCGSAGIAIAKLMLAYGFNNVTICDSRGIVTKENANNPVKKEIAGLTNPDGLSGSLADALVGADIFIGVSAPNIVDEQMIRSMNDDPMIFALSNPTPEVMPDVAKAAGARIIGTGRSDFPNQINNVLVFPGIFRGALDARAPQITEGMKMAAAKGLASLIADDELKPEYIIPDAFDPRAMRAVADAVMAEAQKESV